MMTRKQCTFLVVGLLAICAGSSAGWTAQAQSSGWQPPTQLSQTGFFAWFPDIAADAAGRIHVTWSSGENRYDTVVYTTILNAGGEGGAWTQPTDIVAFRQGDLGESAATRSGLLVDKRGYLQLTYTDYLEIFHIKAFQDRTTSLQAWTEPQTVNTETSTYFSRMAEDSRGVFHLVYTQNLYSDDCRRCLHLYHRSSPDGGDTWSSATDISLLQTGSAKPQIIVDRNDNVHVVWESGFGGTLGQLAGPTKVLYSASYDGGKSWTPPYELTTGAPGAQGRSPAIAEDGEGNLVVVWRGAPDEVVYSQVSRDGGRSWSAPQRIPGVYTTAPVYNGPTDTYAMATDGAGAVHLVLAGRLDENQQTLSLLHLVRRDGAWSEPTQIAPYPNGDVPEWPRIAAGLGNQLHVTWFTRDRANVFGSDSATTDYRVWYSRAVSDAPAVAPVPYPTPMPRAGPLPTSPPALPLATPKLVSAALPQLEPRLHMNELDDMLLLLVSAFPAVALVALFLFLRRRRG